MRSAMLTSGSSFERPCLLRRGHYTEAMLTSSSSFERSCLLHRGHYTKAMLTSGSSFERRRRNRIVRQRCLAADRRAEHETPK